MTVALITSSRVGNGAPLALGFEAAAEAAEIARAYSETAAAFALIGDRRGLAYALRQAAVAIASAADAAAAIGSHSDGGCR